MESFNVQLNPLNEETCPVKILHVCNFQRINIRLVKKHIDDHQFLIFIVHFLFILGLNVRFGKTLIGRVAFPVGIGSIAEAGRKGPVVDVEEGMHHICHTLIQIVPDRGMVRSELLRHDERD